MTATADQPIPSAPALDSRAAAPDTRRSEGRARSAPGTSPVGALTRTVVLKALRGAAPAGLTIVDDRGSALFQGPPAGHGEPAATVVIHGDSAFSALLQGSSGFARAHADGLWDCDDLVSLVRILARALSGVDGWRARLGVVAGPGRHLAAALRSNSRARSRENVERHYDLGNGFFSHVLDETMGYSCAYWEHAEMAAVDASRANLDRVCRLLDLRPGDRLLEMGSGWGGLAVHAAEHYGARVSTVTISKNQRDHIDELAARRGVAGSVEVLLADYRDIRGSWDKLVSLEMVESIGADHLDDFLAQWGRLLRPDGLAVMQAITTTDQLYRIDRYRRTFLNRLIFPGGFVPSLEAILSSAARTTRLRAVAVYDITAHYPPTLRAWRQRLVANWPAIEQLGGSDEPFRRLWILYLAYCEAAFLERRALDRQIIFAGPRWRDERRLLAWSPELGARPARSPA